MKIFILIRTSNRPEYFERCIRSVKAQRHTQYPVEVIVGNDNNEQYCEGHGRVMRFKREPWNRDTAPRIDTSVYFPFNGYLDKMLKSITKQGWVMILDDDDYFIDKNALNIIMDHIGADTQAAFWRVDICGNVVPSDKNWEKHPKKRDFSMIGMLFPTKYIPLITIAPYKQADWRLADQIYGLCEIKWINKILTQTENEGRGSQNDL